MSQYVALSDVLPNKTRCSLPLDIIQPPSASLQTVLRPIERDSPEVNNILFKTDMILPTCIGETLN